MEKVNKDLIKKRFAKSLESYHEEAVVQKAAAERMLDLLCLADLERQYESVLEIGCGSGILTDLIESRLDYRQLLLNDIIPEIEAVHQGRANSHFMIGDIEKCELDPLAFDIILSNAVFQWVNDFPLLLDKLHQALKPGGILAFCTFGERNFEEVAQLTAKKLKYFTADEVSAMLSRHFEVLAVHEEIHVLHFPNVQKVLEHMRLTGVTATGENFSWTKGKMQKFMEEYYRRFTTPEKNVALTYHPLIFIVKKK